MTTQTANFLVEIGTAELPPTELKQIIADFKQGLINQLNNANLSFSEVIDYATPRRLALLVKNISTLQSSKQITLRGPKYEAAFTADGNPTTATLGWLTSNNLTLSQTHKLQQGEQYFIAYQYQQPGKNFTELANEIVQQAITNIKINKGMRWGDKDFIFIRPVLSYTLLLDKQLIPGSLFGVNSTKKILAHRFQANNFANDQIRSFILDDAIDYEKLLAQHFVIADFQKRQQIILQQAQQLAATVNGELQISDNLLDEITSLSEWPKSYLASFDPSFLEVPKEPLVITMEEDQRYFPLYQGDKLLPYFIFVSNVEPQDPSLIIAGNQRVVTPRLADAQFFYRQDLKIPLNSYQNQLHKIDFQAKLGTMQDKTDRLVAIVTYLAQQIQPNNNQLANDVTEAAQLSKCDLLTNLVREYPTTQGKSGYYYAIAQGYNQQIAVALYEQYLPRFSGDQLPSSLPGALLSLADKLDNLIAIFGIGLLPKGTKDPFALRRAAIGILRILVELKINLDLVATIKFTLQLLADKVTNQNAYQQLVEFLQTRQKVIYQEAGYTVEEINSIQALGLISPLDFDLRIQAIHHFQNSPSFIALTKANKRINNLLSKTQLNNSSISLQFCETTSEKNLVELLLAQQQKIQPLLQQANYSAVLESLSQLSGAIDEFFEHNMINHQDSQIRENRYSIIKFLHNLLLQVADFDKLK